MFRNDTCKFWVFSTHHNHKMKYILWGSKLKRHTDVGVKLYFVSVFIISTIGFCYDLMSQIFPFLLKKQQSLLTFKLLLLTGLILGRLRAQVDFVERIYAGVSIVVACWWKDFSNPIFIMSKSGCLFLSFLKNGFSIRMIHLTLPCSGSVFCNQIDFPWTLRVNQQHRDASLHACQSRCVVLSGQGKWKQSSQWWANKKNRQHKKTFLQNVLSILTNKKRITAKIYSVKKKKKS